MDHEYKVGGRVRVIGSCDNAGSLHGAYIGFIDRVEGVDEFSVIGKEYEYDFNEIEPVLDEPTAPNGWSSDYYKIPEGAKELQDLIEFKNMNFAVGNIFKACWRLGSKPGVEEAYDLRKIIWFATRELKRIGEEV